MKSTETNNSLMQQFQIGYTPTVLVVDAAAADLAYCSTIIQLE